MTDARDEIARLLLDYGDGPGAFYGDDCPQGFAPGDPMNDADEAGYMADLILDALTKPRTGQPCEPCRGTGEAGHHHGEGVDCDSGCNPGRCPSCSGSGTVTRGPIAVLVDGE